MKSRTQTIREQRSESSLEVDLWEVINTHLRKKETKCDAKLRPLNIIYVLGSMIKTIVAQMQGYK